MHACSLKIALIAVAVFAMFARPVSLLAQPESGPAPTADPTPPTQDWPVTVRSVQPLTPQAANNVTPHTLPAPQEPRSITVVGRGVSSAAPDRAQVSLGVSSQKVTAADAQNEVNNALGQSLEALKVLGIARKSITTASINLYPIYENPRPNPDGRIEDPPRVVAYRASNTIRITLDDLTLIGKVIDACIKAGCNQLEGVVFELKDDSSQRRDALAAACVDAAAKAETIASSLKLRILGVHEITEAGVGIQPPMPMFRGRGIEAMVADSAQTAVEPGSVKVEAGVTIRYLIEPYPPR